MKRTFLRPSLLIAITLTLSGCGIYYKYDISSPVGANGRNENFSKIKYSDFDLHIRPLNDVKAYEYAAIVIIPVYVSTKDKPELAYYRELQPYDRNSEFRILVAILPKGEGYSLNAETIKVSIDGVATSLSGIEGPIRYLPWENRSLSTQYWEQRPTEQQLAIASGLVFSAVQKEGPRKTIGRDNVKIDVSQTGLWNCFELIFKCKTPLPEQDIKLNLEGLTKGNVTIDIPTIEFKKSALYGGDSCP
jgi:hypothetical protein